MTLFAQGGGGLTMMLLWMIPIFVIFYMLLIRPQKKREQERKAMIEALRKNDEVVTIGGIYGVVTALKENEVTLKVDEASNVKLRMSRSAISRVVDKSSGEEGEKEDKES